MLPQILINAEEQGGREKLPSVSRVRAYGILLVLSGVGILTGGLGTVSSNNVNDATAPSACYNVESTSAAIEKR